jgi:hypothetical protein
MAAESDEVTTCPGGIKDIMNRKNEGTRSRAIARVKDALPDFQS